MKKILGIDLGTSSIGYALVDKEKKEILHLGTYIFPSAIQKEGNKDIIPNAIRREKRGARKLVHRTKQRKANLLRYLAKHQMIPLNTKEIKKWLQDTTKGKYFFVKDPIQLQENKKLQAWLTLNPYELRHKALKEKITLHHLGRLLYHIAQRRGFQSNRKEGNKGNQKTLYQGLHDKKASPILYKAGITETENYLKEKKTTLGNFLYEISPEGHYKQETPRIRSRYTTRKMYIDEFDRIWDKQAPHHPTLNNTKLREALGGKKEDKKRSGILFSQRPLQSQNHLTGKCTLDPTKTRCPISHPLFEEFRAYSFVNNIKVNEKPINKQSREAVVTKLLTTKKEISLTTLKKCIQEKGTLNYDNGRDDTNIKGSPTIASLQKIFKKKWTLLSNEQSTTSLTSAEKNNIWHALYTYDDDELLQAHAQDKFKLTKQDALDLSKIYLPEGYAKFSVKALKLIVPFLHQGHLEYKAIALAGVHNAFNHHQKEHPNLQTPLQDIIQEVNTIITNHTNHQKDATGGYLPLIKEFLQHNYNFSEKSLKKLYPHSNFSPETKKDLWPTNKQANQKIQALRNPNVMKSVFMLRKVYNALFKTYGKPDSIRIELARDLKNSKKEKEAIDKRNKVNNTINREVIKKLEELGQPLTLYNKLKYTLWEEANHQCPYTLKPIALQDLFNATWELEHIIPRSHSVDDSFNNLTLCDLSINKLKKNQTPYEFFKKNPHLLPEHHTWESYVEQVKNSIFKTSPFIKACYAKSGTKLKPPTYATKCNRLISKKNTQDLEEINSRMLNDTRYISREATKQLKQFCKNVTTTKGQITSILRDQWNLNYLLNTEEENKKNRDDHRHHAIDALVIACTDDVAINHLSKTRGSDAYIKQWEAWKKSPRQHKKPDYPNIKAPWDNIKQVEDQLDKLLVSYHSPNKIIAPITKTIKKKYIDSHGKVRYKKDQKTSLSLRGSLHEDTYYGRHTTLEDGKEESYYHVRKPISKIEKKKHVDSIVDEGIKHIIKKHIEQQGGYKNNTDVPPLYKKIYHIQKTPSEHLTEADTIALYDHNKIKDNIQLHLSLLQEEAKSTLKTKLVKVSSLKEQQHIDLMVDTNLQQRIRQRIHQLGGYVQGKKNKKIVPPNTFNDKTAPILKQEPTYLTEKDRVELYDNTQRKNTQFVQLSLFQSTPPQLPTYEINVSKLKHKEHVECIVNKQLKEAIKQRIKHLRGYVTDTILEEKNKRDTQYLIPHKTFFSINPTLFLPNNKGGDKVPIKKIRIRVKSDKMIQLSPSLNKYVKPGNNHCTLIYSNPQGQQQAKVFSFFDIVRLYQDAYRAKRTLQEQIQHLHPDNNLTMLLREGDFILHTKDLDPQHIDWHDHSLLSQHLYRVKKMTEKKIHFIHHSTAQFKEWRDKQYTTQGQRHKKTSNVDYYKHDPEVDGQIPLVLSSNPTKLQALQVTIDTLGNIKQVDY